MLKDLLMVWQARSWMKRNESFLPTWHVYVGYKLDLFQRFAYGSPVQQVIDIGGYEPGLIKNWVDVGIELGHLKWRKGQVYAKKQMLQYFTQQSPYTIGELIKEMIEMHMPALMRYPDILMGKERNTYQGDLYGKTVASTSELIAKRALPFVHKGIKHAPGTRILDIGCGNGCYLLQLAKKLEKGPLVGIDINQTVIEQAKREVEKQQFKHVHFYHQSLETYMEQAEKQDVILMNNVLHYFHPEARSALMQSAAPLLNPGGRLIIITPLYLEKVGRRFSLAFNAYMSSHQNLYGLPQRADLLTMAEHYKMRLMRIKPIVSEGSWYCLVFEKTM